MEAHGETRPRKRANRKLNREQHKNVEVPEPDIHTRDEEEVKLRHSFSEEEEDASSLTYKILFFLILLALGGLATIVLIDGNNSYELGKASSSHYSEGDNGLEDVPIHMEEATVASSWFDWLTNEEEDHDHHHVEEFTDEPHEFHDDHDDEDDHVGEGHGDENAQESERVELKQEQPYPLEEETPQKDYSVPDVEAGAMEFESPESQEYEDQHIISLDDEDDVNNLDSEPSQSYEYVQAESVIQDKEFMQVEDQILAPPSHQEESDEAEYTLPEGAPEEESQILPPQHHEDNDEEDGDDDEDSANPPRTSQRDGTNGEPQADFYAPENIDSDVDDNGGDEKYIREQLLRSMGAVEEGYEQARHNQPNQYNQPPNSVDEEEDIFDAHQYK